MRRLKDSRASRPTKTSESNAYEAHKHQGPSGGLGGGGEITRKSKDNKTGGSSKFPLIDIDDVVPDKGI